MSQNRYASVWDAIEDDPEVAESMKLRSKLMIAITSAIETRRLTQSKASKILGVSQPRVSDLKQGKINLFSLDTLVNMALALGLGVELQVKAPRKTSKRALSAAA
jgi:predicted XRE-type DNA-binding protein